MRRLNLICIFLYLLTPSLTFAADTPDCAEFVPDDENFIISGTLFRKTIHCLEDLIEAKHAEKAVVKTEETHTKKGEIKPDTNSMVSIQLTNKADQKTIATISFTDQKHKKTIELPLN